MQGLFKNPLVLALLASVLLNGVLIGKAMSPKPATDGPVAGQTDMRPRGGPSRLETLPRYLSPEQRARFDEMTKASGRKDVRKAFSDLRAARKTVNELLRADTLDSPALRAAMADVRTKAIALAELSDESIAAFLETSTAQERKDILEAMKRKGGRKGGRGPGGRKDGPKGERR